MKKLIGLLGCLLGSHKWTSAAEQGIPPTKEQLESVKSGSLEGFYDYATMYCSCCGKISEYSLREKVSRIRLFVK